MEAACGRVQGLASHPGLRLGQGSGGVWEFEQVSLGAPSCLGTVGPLQPGEAVVDAQSPCAGAETFAENIGGCCVALLYATPQPTGERGQHGRTGVPEEEAQQPHRVPGPESQPRGRLGGTLPSGLLAPSHVPLSWGN